MSPPILVPRMLRSADAPDGGADDPAGLTVDEYATLGQYNLMIWGVFVAAAGRRLTAGRPVLEGAVTLAESHVSETLETAQPYREAITRLETKLSEAQEYTAGLAAAVAGDDFRAKIRAGGEQATAEQVLNEIHGELQDAHRTAEPALSALRQAEHDAGLARRDLESLDHAITNDPLAHPLASELHEQYLLITGLWHSQNRHSEPARRIATGWLRSVGLLAELESRAIAEFKSGLRPHEGGTKHFHDDNATMYNPGDGGVPVVVHSEASPGDLAGLPPVQTSAPTGQQVMDGMRTGAGQPPPAGMVTKAARREPLEMQVRLPTAITEVIH